MRIAAGHLIYSNKATLFAVPFDPDKLETRGTAVPILDEVAYDKTTGTGQLDFSRAPSGHGTVHYRRASGGAPQWQRCSGSIQPAGKNRWRPNPAPIRV